jgi:ABC-type uncharacterized transport system auxiliary subunit
MKLAIVALCASCISGGALTEKSEPGIVRYFSVQTVGIAAHVEGASVRVRLGRVTSSANLRRRIVRRRSEVELDAYDSWRWTENPEDYVTRALYQELQPLELTSATSAPILDVDVVAFEEVDMRHQRSGRVALIYRLYDDRRVLAHGVIAPERTASSDSIEAVVAAIGDAMRTAVAQMSNDVAAHVQ